MTWTNSELWTWVQQSSTARQFDADEPDKHSQFCLVSSLVILPGKRKYSTMEATAPSTSDGGQVSDEPLSQRSGSIIEDRPKLQPKRPSTRPFSPIRKQVILLETAQPSVAIRQPQQWVVSGDQVKVLSSVLGKNGLQGVIPSVFKVSFTFPPVLYRIFNEEMSTETFVLATLK